jgi:hypothetical protein
MQRDQFMKRIYVNVTEEQHDALKARAKRLGSTVSEEIRRAVHLGLAATKPWKATRPDGTSVIVEPTGDGGFDFFGGDDKKAAE